MDAGKPGDPPRLQRPHARRGGAPERGGRPPAPGVDAVAVEGAPGRQIEELSGREGPVLAPEGWPFVFGGAAFAIVVALLWPRGIPLAALGLLFALFSLWFFRNPDRTPPPGPGVIVSPADGRIVYAGECPPGRYAAQPGKKISVFMSPLAAHVSRAPVTGRVASVRYHKGAFHVASVDKASLMNEQNGVEIATPGGGPAAHGRTPGGRRPRG